MSWWRDLLGLRPERPDTRLDEAEAIEIGEQALAASSIEFSPGLLRVADVERTDDDVVWRLFTYTRGLSASVTVSDTTGRAVEVRRHGFR